MSVKIFDTPEVQNFLNTVAGFDQEGGNDRARQIIHRIVSDLYKTIDDFDVTPEEFWSAVSVLNALGAGTQFGLLAPGLGFDHYLDLRMDAADRQAGLTGGTPRTIEGPLYVAGAPETEGLARMDDGADTEAEVLIVHIRSEHRVPTGRGNDEFEIHGLYLMFKFGEMLPVKLRRSL